MNDDGAVMKKCVRDTIGIEHSHAAGIVTSIDKRFLPKSKTAVRNCTVT